MTDIHPYFIFILNPSAHDCCHAYSRKYSRFIRLRLLGSDAPYFRNLPSKNNYQLFFSVVYRLS